MIRRWSGKPRPPAGRVLPGLVALAIALGTSPVSASGPSQAASGEINGMTLSTPRGSSEWGKDHVAPAITDLRGLGVNWIAVHPYARIERDGTVRWRRRGEDWREAPRWLRRPIEEAHAQGVKILIKPHLAHWGSFSWRGEIEFDDPAEWDRFFRTYRDWISTVAGFVTDADALAVGTELDRTIAHESRWRRIIADVRSVYDGPLTYAANWTDFERVPFWDALDAVGIQAYFPVLERREAAGQVPSQAALDDGWSNIMDRLRSFSAATGKPIVFTELGYNLSAAAPYEPWDYEVGGINAEILQERCLRAALRAIDREPAVVGAFLWKWFPGERQPRNFAMSSPEMRRVISEHWLLEPGR